MLKYQGLSGKLLNIITFFLTTSLVAAILIEGGMIVSPTATAQSQTNLSAVQSQNTTATNTAGEEKTYILIFGQRTIGNIDNSTRIVSSIVGNNSAKIQEEFLEEISLAPSQQLEQQVAKIVNDGISGSSCPGVRLTTQEGENVSVDCISSGNYVIWYIHPTT
jgi:hypothetical protein